MIQLLEGFPDNVLAFFATGMVTKEDYVEVLVPNVERALSRHGKLRLYYEFGVEFEGFDPLTTRVDGHIFTEHAARWERVAVVTDADLVRLQTQCVHVHGEVRIFPLAEAAAAERWIKAP